MCREGMIDSEKDVNGERTRKWLLIITEKTETTEGYKNGCLLLQKRRKQQKETKNSVVFVVSEFFCNKVNKEFKTIVNAQR